MTQTDEAARLMEAAGWLEDRVALREGAHYRASDHLRLAHYVVGFLLIGLSAVVSSTILQGAQGNPSRTVKMAAGIMAVAVTILTAVQTTFKLGERGEQHRAAAAAYSRTRAELRLFRERTHRDLEASWAELTSIAGKMGDIDAGSPGFLRSTLERARDEATAGIAARAPG
ncbi:MAG: SLATT domain-containing protein [Thermoleophilia bacterium]